MIQVSRKISNNMSHHRAGEGSNKIKRDQQILKMGIKKKGIKKKITVLSQNAARNEAIPSGFRIKNTK